MSILIKGMPMPANCFECPLMTDYGTCGFYALYTDRSEIEASWERRPDRCPLVEVPQHGRLVDADRIGLTDFEIIMCDGDYRELAEMLLNKIAAAPTIIESEEGE